MPGGASARRGVDHALCILTLVRAKGGRAGGLRNPQFNAACERIRIHPRSPAREKQSFTSSHIFQGIAVSKNDQRREGEFARTIHRSNLKSIGRSREARSREGGGESSRRVAKDLSRYKVEIAYSCFLFLFFLFLGISRELETLENSKPKTSIGPIIDRKIFMANGSLRDDSRVIVWKGLIARV